MTLPENAIVQRDAEGMIRFYAVPEPFDYRCAVRLYSVGCWDAETGAPIDPDPLGELNVRWDGCVDTNLNIHFCEFGEIAAFGMFLDKVHLAAFLLIPTRDANAGPKTV